MGHTFEQWIADVFRGQLESAVRVMDTSPRTNIPRVDATGDGANDLIRAFFEERAESIFGLVGDQLTDTTSEIAGGLDAVMADLSSVAEQFAAEVGKPLAPSPDTAPGNAEAVADRVMEQNLQHIVRDHRGVARRGIGIRGLA